VQQSVAYGVGQGRVADIGMPVFNRALAGDNGGSRLVAVLDDLQQISPFAVLIAFTVLFLLVAMKMHQRTMPRRI
jgi:hypothetical protein